MVSTVFLISENCIMRSFSAHFYLDHHTKSVKWEGHVVHTGAREKHRELEGRHERNMVLGRSRYRWSIILK